MPSAVLNANRSFVVAFYGRARSVWSVFTITYRAESWSRKIAQLGVEVVSVSGCWWSANMV